MEKRNRHGALWSKEDEKAQLIGFVQAEDLEEAAKQAALFRENEVDILVYDEEELNEVYAVGDVRTKALRQIVTAVADGAAAVHQAEEYLQTSPY